MLYRSTAQFKKTYAEETYGDDIEVWMGRSDPRQETVVAALEACSLVSLLPSRHQKVIRLRMDGANPFEIAAELEMDAGAVLAVLNEARVWLGDGGAYLHRRKNGTSDND